MNTQLMQKKQGNRISINDLYEFINTNQNVFQNIGCINLNESVMQQQEELEKLQFQDVKKIYTFPYNIMNFLQVENSKIKYLHAGTFVKTKGSINLSLFSSIISCLKYSFLSQTIISQEKFLIFFINRLKNDLNGLFFLHKYDKLYNWSKDEIINDLNNGIFSGQILHILCDYFCINIFVFDIESDEMYFGGGMHYIPYRKSIFLLKFDNDTFEPLFTDQTRVFMLSDEPIKIIRNKIRTTKLYPVYGYGVTKPEEFEEDLVKYNPPLKKSKKELRLEKEKAEKLKAEQKNEEDLEEMLEKIDNILSEQISTNIAEYDETINGFTEDHENISEHKNIEEIIEKNNKKNPKKTEWVINEDILTKSNEKKPTKKQKTNDTSVNITQIKTMKVSELQQTASKLKLQTRENGKAMTKQQLLSTIEKYLSESTI